MAEEDPHAELRAWLIKTYPHGKLHLIETASGIDRARISSFRNGQLKKLHSSEMDRLYSLMRQTGHRPLSTRNDTREDVQEENTAIFFRFNYPDQLRIDLQLAHALSAMGTSLRRLNPLRQRITKLVSRGGNVQIIFTDPTIKELCRYETIQEFGDDTKESNAAFMDRLVMNARWWFELKSKYDKLIEIRKIDYPLACGIDAFEFENRKGSVYVQFYPLVRNREEDERPIVQIREDSNSLWYEYYVEQFRRHWALANTWDKLPS